MEDLRPVDAKDPSEIEQNWQFYGLAALFGFFVIISFITKIMKSPALDDELHRATGDFEWNRATGDLNISFEFASSAFHTVG